MSESRFIDQDCVPYKRKPLYLILTLPMISAYMAIALLLWRIHAAFLAVYLALFMLVSLSMSYVCVYWRCPYVGKFAPCVGGFCLPSSRIALLLRRAKRSERRYKASMTLAYVGFFGIILFPIPFLYLTHIGYLVGYLSAAAVYVLLFTLFICPVCATRHLCPGGQAAVKLRESIARFVDRADRT